MIPVRNTEDLQRIPGEEGEEDNPDGSSSSLANLRKLPAQTGKSRAVLNDNDACRTVGANM